MSSRRELVRAHHGLKQPPSSPGQLKNGTLLQTMREERHELLQENERLRTELEEANQLVTEGAVWSVCVCGTASSGMLSLITPETRLRIGRMLCEDAGRELDRTHQAKEEVQAKLVRVQEQLMDMRREVRESEVRRLAELVVAQRELEEAESEVSRAKADLLQLSQKRFADLEQRARVERELGQLHETASRLSKEKQELQATVEETEQQLQMARHRCAEIERARDELQRDHESTCMARDDNQVRVQELDASCEALREQNRTLAKDLNVARMRQEEEAASALETKTIVGRQLDDVVAEVERLRQAEKAHAEDAFATQEKLRRERDAAIHQAKEAEVKENAELMALKVTLSGLQAAHALAVEQHKGVAAKLKELENERLGAEEAIERRHTAALEALLSREEAQQAEACEIQGRLERECAEITSQLQLAQDKLSICNIEKHVLEQELQSKLEAALVEAQSLKSTLAVTRRERDRAHYSAEAYRHGAQELDAERARALDAAVAAEEQRKSVEWQLMIHTANGLAREDGLSTLREHLSSAAQTLSESAKVAYRMQETHDETAQQAFIEAVWSRLLDDSSRLNRNIPAQEAPHAVEADGLEQAISVTAHDKSSATSALIATTAAALSLAQASSPQKQLAVAHSRAG